MCGTCECSNEQKPKQSEVPTSRIELELVLLEEAVSCLSDTIKYAFEVKDKDSLITQNLTMLSELPARDYLKKAYKEQLFTYSENVRMEVLDILNRVNNVCTLFSQWELKECITQQKQDMRN